MRRIGVSAKLVKLIDQIDLLAVSVRIEDSGLFFTTFQEECLEIPQNNYDSLGMSRASKYRASSEPSIWTSSLEPSRAFQNSQNSSFEPSLPKKFELRAEPRAFENQVKNLKSLLC